MRWGSETYEGVHKPLISKKLFDRCQSVMEQRGRVHIKQNPTEHPFRNLLACDYCGCSITSSIAKKKYTYYHCTKRKGHCRGKYISDKAIDEKIRAVLKKFSLPKETADEMINCAEKIYQADERAGSGHLEALQNDLRTQDKKLDALLDLNLNGDITRDEYLTKKEKLTTEKYNLRAKIHPVQTLSLIHISEPTRPY